MSAKMCTVILLTINNSYIAHISLSGPYAPTEEKQCTKKNHIFSPSLIHALASFMQLHHQETGNTKWKSMRVTEKKKQCEFWKHR